MEFSVQIVSVPNSCFQNVWERMVPLIPQGNLEHLVDQLGPGVSLYYSFKCFIRQCHYKNKLILHVKQKKDLTHIFSSNIQGFQCR